MTDSEALRKKLENAPDWRYVETRTRQALESAMQNWARLREARVLAQENNTATDADGR